MCIISSLESTSRFISSASPVLSRFTSSSICQPISLIISALIIHRSFPPGSKPTFYLLDCLHDTGTGPDLSHSIAHQFIFSFHILIFCSFHVVDKAGYQLAFYCTLISYCIKILCESSPWLASSSKAHSDSSS